MTQLIDFILLSNLVLILAGILLLFPSLYLPDMLLSASKDSTVSADGAARRRFPLSMAVYRSRIVNAFATNGPLWMTMWILSALTGLILMVAGFFRALGMTANNSFEMNLGILFIAGFSVLVVATLAYDLMALRSLQQQSIEN